MVVGSVMVMVGCSLVRFASTPTVRGPSGRRSSMLRNRLLRSRYSVFSDEMTAFLQSGCSLIVGTVGPDGEPHAGRAWGLDVLDPRGRVQLLLDAADERTLAHA